MAKCHVFGNHIDTDVIIPARYLNTTDAKELASYCMIDIDPNFASKVVPGDLIIAGKNFGCGSSREHAPLAIKTAGISFVVAKSFARIFLRNAINIGLPVIVADTDRLQAENGDHIEVSADRGIIRNVTKNTEVTFNIFPEFINLIIEAGGLMNAVSKITKGEKAYE